jgi:hypothetical protein
MRFRHEQLAVVELLSRIPVEKNDQPLHGLWNDLRVVVQLNCDDARVVRGRLGHDVGKITVEGKQNGPQFLRFGDGNRVD